MSTGVQRESDGPASENRHRCFVHRGLSQDKILPVRRQNAKRPTISWDDRGRPNTDTKSRSRNVLSTVSGAYRLLVLWSKVANQFDRLDSNNKIKKTKCFIWRRLGSRKPFFLSLRCTEFVPNSQLGKIPNYGPSLSQSTDLNGI